VVCPWTAKHVNFVTNKILPAQEHQHHQLVFQLCPSLLTVRVRLMTLLSHCSLRTWLLMSTSSVPKSKESSLPSDKSPVILLKLELSWLHRIHTLKRFHQRSQHGNNPKDSLAVDSAMILSQLLWQVVPTTTWSMCYLKCMEAVAVIAIQAHQAQAQWAHLHPTPTQAHHHQWWMEWWCMLNKGLITRCCKRIVIQSHISEIEIR
jgi:hypothetical protein